MSAICFQSNANHDGRSARGVGIRLVKGAARDRWVQLMDHALDQATLTAEVTPFLREFFHGTATFLMNSRQ